MAEQSTTEQTSILKTVRRMMGPDEDYEYFDTDLIIHINSAFSRLCQLGVGSEVPFKIHGTEETWDDFMTDGYQEEIKQYIYLKVRMVFDPPASSSVMNAYKEELDKHEWLLREVARFGY